MQSIKPKINQITLIISLFAATLVFGAGQVSAASYACSGAGGSLSLDEFRQAINAGDVSYDSVQYPGANSVGSAGVYNNTNCNLSVSYATYKQFVSSGIDLPNQKLFDASPVKTIPPASYARVEAKTPGCLYQWDLWYGDAPANAGQTDSRKYWAGQFQWGMNICTETPNNPTVDIKANASNGPVTIQSGTQATLSWTSQNATSCSASSGPWSGTKSLNGSESTQPLTQTTTFTITCTNSVGVTDSDSVTVTVNAPPQNTSAIIGRFVKDDNGNGAWDAGELYIIDPNGSPSSCNNEFRQAGFFVEYSGPVSNRAYLDKCQENQPSYRIANLPAGTYNLNARTIAGGWTLTGQTSQTVTLATGEEKHVWFFAKKDVVVLPPTVTITASPNPVNSGSQTNLTWTSTNANTCTASNGWSGTKQAGTNRTDVSLPLTQTTTFTITCFNAAGQSAVDSVTVTVNTPPQAPTVDIKANGSDNPASIAYNSTANLSWVSTNATTCFASSGPWNGAKAINSSETSSSLTQTAVFGITCLGTNGSSISDTVTVNVGTQAQNPTVDIKANNQDGPITIASGAQANLSWTSANATYCYASSGLWSGTKQLNSSEPTPTITQSVTFSITCSNAQGTTISDSVTINVGTQPQAPTVDIKANGSDNPASIAYNSTANLSWTSTNATTCFASSGPWNGTKAINSSETSSSLTQTAVFGITCLGTNGSSISDTVTVNVGTQAQNPTVDIKANNQDGPITIASGAQATLSWTSQNATSCSASSGSWSGTKPLNSSEATPTITQSATYSITCTNSVGATASDSVTVNVTQTQNAPTVDIKANSQDGTVNVNYNSAATLSWTSSNAASCSASGGSWSGSRGLNDSESTGNLTQTRTYTITCQNSQGVSASDSVTVNVGNQQQNAPTVTIYASPNNVISGSQSHLYWTSQNAVSCQSAGGPWYGPKPLNSDEYTQALYQATTYTITCQNAQGQTASQSTTVTVQGGGGGNPGYQYPPTLNLYAQPAQVPVGNTSTLNWNSTNADYCTASGDSQSGNTGWIGNRAINGSQVVGPINNVQNFILTCYGPGGSVVRNTTVSPVGQVLGAAAPALTIYAIPSPVQYGSASNVYWNASNVDRCVAVGDWFGNKPTSGQEQTGPLYAAKTYTMSCYGVGGTITRSAVIPVIGTPTYVPPVVTSTCPAGGCVQGTSGTHGASIDKIIENLSVSGSTGAQVTARPGNELRYTITVRNTGTLTLTNLTVRDPLTDKVEVKTISDAGTYDYTNRTVTWKIARLAAGEIKTLTLTTRVVMCDTDVVIENRAYVKGSQIAEVVSNNTVAGVMAGPFTVNIDNPAPIVAPGDKVTYTVRYRNDSGSTVKGAVLEVYIPAGMIIEGYSQTCTVSGNTVRLNIGDVTAGQAGQVQVIGKIDKGVLDGEQLVTRSVVSYNDASNTKRESNATTMSTVDKDGKGGMISNSDKDAQFANATSAASSRGLSFLPDTFFGWLLLLLLIIVLGIFVKRLLTKD